jgi:hypothetical protein
MIIANAKHGIDMHAQALCAHRHIQTLAAWFNTQAIGVNRLAQRWQTRHFPTTSHHKISNYKQIHNFDFNHLGRMARANRLGVDGMAPVYALDEVHTPFRPDERIKKPVRPELVEG